ncbi:copper resistance CopC/CopD family protein [Azospirillum rugosum]|uniref:Copper transport protein n=1 Tax=Azospirillum rugosum TaxID=416170 RepID=A0ABS4STM0_9PROT|nr:copper resistance protein CopC [Azospirillum rugosum]MBP2295895.1 copper transport protein [Azospirillum rugosum]MDQ0530152.1 copper transport protein [Azospirillum rugosum]
MRRHLTGLTGCFAALLLMLAVTPAVVIMAAPAAWAHAVLVEAVPPDGAGLDRPPAEVSLRFNEPVSPVSVRVLGPGGAELALPSPPAVGAGAGDGTLRIALPAGLAAGTHVVSFRVVSADGHPVAGSILFGIGAAPDRGIVQAEEGRQATLLVAAAARWLHYGSLLAAVGGGLFLALVLDGWSPVGRRLKPGLCLGVGIAALAAVLNVGLAGAVLEGAPLSGLIGASVWKTGVASSTGASAALALLGLVAAALGLALEERGRAGAVLLLAGAAGAALALTATGHAPTAEPRWLSAPLVALHTLGVAFWIGSFWPLAVVLRTEPAAEAARIVRRFSGLAMAAVAVLVLAGAVLSVLQLAEPRAIVDTPYGQIWLGKMVCVLVMLVLAAVNRLRLTPDLAPGLEAAGPAAAARLRGSLFTEMVAAALVLLFTAGLGTTPPPRTRGEVAEAESTGFSTVVTVKGRPALITVTPARPGPNRLAVQIEQADGTPLDAQEVSAELALPSAGIEPISRVLGKAGPGIYAADGVELPLAGEWAVRVDALVSDFEKALYRTEVTVR